MFLFGKELSDIIHDISQEDGAKCAVAFWGRGSKCIVSNGAKVICNLKAGGSNPYELKEIENKLAPGNLRQYDTLHAKVYLGRERAVITSANASANGLGLESGEQAGWLEAGVFQSDIQPIHRWFDDLWAASRAIEKSDWEQAEAAWNARQKRKPTLRSFREFNVEQDRLPMIVAETDETWTYNEEKLSNFDEADKLKQRIDSGQEVSNGDEKAAMENRWFLFWSANKRPPYAPRKRPSFKWSFVGEEDIKSAFKWDGGDSYCDVLLLAEEQPPKPFDASVLEFDEAFRYAIMLPEFKYLRGYDKDEDWYRRAEKLLPSFWASLKKKYDSLL